MKLNFFNRIIYFFQREMERPKAFGWFHLLWIAFTITSVFLLVKSKPKDKNKQLKIILIIYFIIASLLELTKQVIWSFNYDLTTNLITWDYQWYAFPFQLCTTPIYVSLICLFIKKEKLLKSFLAYLAFITILGSLVTIIMPSSCFVKTIEVNIHTMFLHCGSLVISLYLLLTKKVELTKDNLKKAFLVFLVFLLIANSLNILVYNLNILNQEEFNMFYISPYFANSLPFFNIIYQELPYLVFLIIYIIVIFLGEVIVYLFTKYYFKIKEKFYIYFNNKY